jgi:hypothetical protein
LIKNLLERSEKLLDRFLPKVDQAAIDKRVADYVGKLLTGVEQALKRNTEQWKAVFKAIDDASKGEDTKWFRTLVANVDSSAFATAADAETAKTIKKLGDSSKLLISNLQKISRGITKRQENIRARVKNAIQHIPKVSLLFTLSFTFVFISRLISMIQISNSYFLLVDNRVVMLEPVNYYLVLVVFFEIVIKHLIQFVQC